MDQKRTPRNLTPDDLRHPKPGVIDQRQQRIDPAGTHTVDPNESGDSNSKRPGRDPQDDCG